MEDITRDEPAKIALTAYFTFVSLDAQGKPEPAPALALVTDEEHFLFEAGLQRYLNYKQRGNKREKEVSHAPFAQGNE